MDATPVARDPSRAAWEKAERLRLLAMRHSCPAVEFDEQIRIPGALAAQLDLQALASSHWAPVSLEGASAVVIAAAPGPELAAKAARLLGVQSVSFRVALPEDIVRVIEHSRDLNPGFPAAGGRTALAVVRTLLAHRRLRYSCRRTTLAKARTGLAFLRTGISFITVALVLQRALGWSWLAPLEILLVLVGAVAVVDGLLWYLPSRRQESTPIDCSRTEPTWGTTVLQADAVGPEPAITRTDPVPGAAELRADWNNLSPVMRRRFLASDRTDLAEERTALAGMRTRMARARTGLSFARTGVALAGLGIALMRQFGPGPWSALDFTLIAAGAVVGLEGFRWYLAGRSAGVEGERSVRSAAGARAIWDLFFPPVHAAPSPDAGPTCFPGHLRRPSRPGVWGTTGLALERTVLAERRNVMARLRTVMARSRTGLAIVRTGISLSSVGLGLLVYFGAGSAAWAALDVALVAFGLLLVVDGLWWHLPAERLRAQLPYCFGDFEIALPDYASPAATWSKVSFGHEDA